MQLRGTAHGNQSCNECDHADYRGGAQSSVRSALHQEFQTRLEQVSQEFFAQDRSTTRRPRWGTRTRRVWALASTPITACSLGLEESYFAKHYTSDPLILFRIYAGHQAV